MNIIKLRDHLNSLIRAGHGNKIAGIAQITALAYNEVRGFDITDDLRTLLICTWDTVGDLGATWGDLP